MLSLCDTMSHCQGFAGCKSADSRHFTAGQIRTCKRKGTAHSPCPKTQPRYAALIFRLLTRFAGTKATSSCLAQGSTA